jgi:hypothetical protein
MVSASASINVHLFTQQPKFGIIFLFMSDLKEQFAVHEL